MLTTHFIQLCSLFEKEKKIINWKMNPAKIGKKIIHSYKIVKGISKIRGGICVLRQLNYPSIILKETKNINPVNPYSVSKAFQDLLAQIYFKSYGLKIIITRMFSYINPRKKYLFQTAFAKQIIDIERGKKKY